MWRQLLGIGVNCSPEQFAQIIANLRPVAIGPDGGTVDHYEIRDLRELWVKVPEGVMHPDERLYPFIRRSKLTGVCELDGVLVSALPLADLEDILRSVEQ